MDIGAWYVYDIMVILQTPKSLHATTKYYSSCESFTIQICTLFNQ